ncbi:MAG: IS66 family transposase [Planctomycetota bacterium]
MSRADVATLLASHTDLKSSHADLEGAYAEVKQQLEWFKRQLFGPKSERRLVSSTDRQLWLGEMTADDAASSSREITVPEHKRRAERPKTRVDEEQIRFDESVPVETVVIPNVEVPADELGEYTVVGEKVTTRLAQRPAAFVVLRIVRKTLKRKADGKFSCPPAPVSVLEKSPVDVSFLAGLLIDKVVYHLPLYRQHQRLAASGIRLGRSTLTNYFHRVVDLLEPIYHAQFGSILESDVLAMDETPIKAGRKKGKPPDRGKMKTGFFWPIYGDRDEVAFPFAPTRAQTVVRDLLKEFTGTLVTDGYKAYDNYTKAMTNVVHAQCWVHVRRGFVQAEAIEPKLAGEALDLIRMLYEQEKKAQELSSPEKVLAYRREHSRPVVDAFFEAIVEAKEKNILLPSNPYTKAVGYAEEREDALRVFLDHPGVQLDTNHVERALRPIAIGRKNWLFCTTEVGAHYLGYVQSLLATCRLHGVDPFAYLVDVLQRVQFHPAKRVRELTPRLWKEHFAAEPFQSMLDRPTG